MTESQTYLDFPGADALQAKGRVAPPSARTLDRALEAVLAPAQAENAQLKQGSAPVVIPIAPRRLLPARRIAAVFATAAVAAGIVIAATTGATPVATRAGAVQHAGTGSATAFLDRVAGVADAQSASTAPYWKVQLRSVITGPHGKNLPATRSSTATMYISRSGYVIESDGHQYKKGSPLWSVGPESVTWNDLDRLPTNQGTLLQMLEAGQSDHTMAFDQAGNILAGAPASPQLRAGLFQALGRLPGVKVVGQVKDSVGRSGTELVYPGPWGAEALIVDPGTSALLETVWWQDSSKSDTTYLSVGPFMTLG